MQAAGFGFLPVVHETTGALGREARDSLLAPLLQRMQEDAEAKLEARAALERVGPLPWNVRSVRSFFLRKVGVAIARGVGASLALAKRRGRAELGRVEAAAKAAGQALLRRPSGLAGVCRVAPAVAVPPLRASSLPAV